ncbi:hypothetical protein A7U60_g2488 [Sanghuangporus baumii]|uniref:Uncharacterized protein n=1 Tax=Sanghuangporus baumii TaxID=108892 RepID=A0A9Q5I250_SANBA|nr:hypothetical protein A7U60_g2488 [Sanghuangporus baumii]
MPPFQTTTIEQKVMEDCDNQINFIVVELMLQDVGMYHAGAKLGTLLFNGNILSPEQDVPPFQTTTIEQKVMEDCDNQINFIVKGRTEDMQDRTKKIDRRIRA